MVETTDFNDNTTTYQYGNSSQPTSVVFVDGTSFTLGYNSLGQTTSRTLFDENGALADQLQVLFDEAGRAIEESAGSDQTTVIRRVFDGDLVDYEVVVAPGSLDSEGRLTESPATPLDQRLSAITDFEYDPNGRLIRRTNAEGGVTEFRYDANGNVILVQDPVGNITTWVYDSLDQISEARDAIYNEGFTIDEAIANLQVPSGADCDSNLGVAHVGLTCYDEEGNLTKTIDRIGRRIEFDHDHAGRATEERWYDVNQDLVQTLTFGYDEVGNMISASGPNSGYAFTYDTLNRLSGADNNPNGTLDVPFVVLTYSHDGQGNRTRVEDSLGVVVESEYDGRDQLRSRKWFGSDIDPARVDFLHNAAGRETEITRYSDLDAEQLVGRTVRTYDSAGRSERISHENALDEVLAEYDYDYNFMSRIVQEQRTHLDPQLDDILDYHYDLTGQVVETSRAGTTAETFDYDANGNPSDAGIVNSTANRIRTDGEFEYDYDAEGNLTSKTDLVSGEETTYSYDHRDRLVRAVQTTTNGIILSETEFTFDALGRRIAKTVNGQTLHTVYDGDHAWADFDSEGAVAARYLFGERTDQILARSRAGEQTAWYLTDARGSVRGLTDVQGNLLTHIDYDAFGAVRSVTDPTAIDRFLFTGREWDAELEMYYYRARFYDPGIGRFTSEDPLWFAANDTNLTRYVFNDPLNQTDPTGLASALEYVGIITFLAAYVGAAAGVAGAACTTGLNSSLPGNAVAGAAAGAGSVVLGGLGGVGAATGASAGFGAGPGAAAGGSLGAVLAAAAFALNEARTCFTALNSPPSTSSPSAPATPPPQLPAQPQPTPVWRPPSGTPTVTGGPPVFVTRTN